MYLLGCHTVIWQTILGILGAHGAFICSIQESKIQCGMPKDFKLKHHCCENLKSCILNIEWKTFIKIYSQWYIPCHLTPWNCMMMALWLKELPHETAADKGCFSTITANDDLSCKAHTGRTKTEHKRILYVRQQKQTNFNVSPCIFQFNNW